MCEYFMLKMRLDLKIYTKTKARGLVLKQIAKFMTVYAKMGFFGPNSMLKAYFTYMTYKTYGGPSYEYSWNGRNLYTVTINNYFLASCSRKFLSAENLVELTTC